MGPRARAKHAAVVKRKSKKDVPGSKEKPKKRGKQEQEEKQEQKKQKKAKSDYERFVDEIKARMKQLDKFCVMLGKLPGGSSDEEENEEEREPSIEQLHALARVYVPKQFETYYNEISRSLFQIGCSPPCSDYDDDDDEGGSRPQPRAQTWIIRGLCTRHSYPMQSILKGNLNKVDKALRQGRWPDAFCLWAATVLAGRNEGHWFEDTDVPEVAEAIYEKMRKQWMKLRQHSDEELGGLVAEGCTSARHEFEAYLQGLADEMQDMYIDVTDVIKKGKAKGGK